MNEEEIQEMRRLAQELSSAMWKIEILLDRIIQLEGRVDYLEDTCKTRVD